MSDDSIGAGPNELDQRAMGAIAGEQSFAGRGGGGVGGKWIIKAVADEILDLVIGAGGRGAECQSEGEEKAGRANSMWNGGVHVVFLIRSR